MKCARKLKILNSEKGITLIELVVVIFIILLFSLIVISDFPKIQRQYALSSVTYKLAQDLKRAQDLGLSGVSITDQTGVTLIPVKGYGVYINYTTQPAEKYIIYADVADANGNFDQKYSGDLNYPLCSKADQSSGPLISDCVVDIVDVSQQNSTLYISGIENISTDYTSINFSPPNPTIKIDNIASNTSPITIELSNGMTTRKVQVNTSGLINVQ